MSERMQAPQGCCCAVGCLPRPGRGQGSAAIMHCQLLSLIGNTYIKSSGMRRDDRQHHPRSWLGEIAAGGGHLVGVVQLYPLDPVGGAGGASAAGQPPLLLATDWPVNTPSTSCTTMRLELSGPLF